MKKIVVIIVAASVCLLGCKQEKKELHDPLLRQQLTAIVASLNDEDTSVAEKAFNEISAILSVNSAKLGEDQKKKLSLIQFELAQLGADIENRNFEKIMSPGKPVQKIERVDRIKQEISEVAGTF
jgi:cob(I)alamin adenosyltransferase